MSGSTVFRGVSFHSASKPVTSGKVGGVGRGEPLRAGLHRTPSGPSAVGVGLVAVLDGFDRLRAGDHSV